MNIDADAALVIGDSLEGDVKGSLAAGIHAVWLNREEVDGNHPYRTSLSGWRLVDSGSR